MSTATRSLLLIEDNDSLSRSLIPLFEMKGIIVTLCRDAESALSFLTTNSRIEEIDAILCDVSLPGGPVEPIILAARNREKPIPITIYTGSTSKQMKDYLLAMGAANFLEKPSSFPDLFLAIFPDSE